MFTVALALVGGAMIGYRLIPFRRDLAITYLIPVQAFADSTTYFSTGALSTGSLRAAIGVAVLSAVGGRIRMTGINVTIISASDYEGRPLVAKEAVACGLPVASVDVGDVLNGVSDSYGVERNSNNIAEKIEEVAGTRTNGPDNAGCFSNGAVARELRELYEEVAVR